MVNTILNWSEPVVVGSAGFHNVKFIVFNNILKNNLLSMNVSLYF